MPGAQVVLGSGVGANDQVMIGLAGPCLVERLSSLAQTQIHVLHLSSVVCVNLGSKDFHLACPWAIRQVTSPVPLVMSLKTFHSVNT